MNAPAVTQFSAFVVAGGLAALVNFGSRIVLGHWMPYWLSVVVAYLIGMMTAFALNRLFVFKSPSQDIRSQALWFAVINLAAVAQTLAVSLMLYHWIFPVMGLRYHSETLAHAVGVAVPVVTSYLGHKRLTFR